jgi:hypothetical protein
MNAFGRLEIQDAVQVGSAKFQWCPWHFFDGVADKHPNEICWPDFAITRVMSSGVSNALIDAALSRNHDGAIGNVLMTIPTDHDLVVGEESEDH